MARKSINKVILSGNLGKDPIIRKTPDGNPVAATSLAVTDYKGNVSWANIVAFGKQAELFRDHLNKGDSIAVVGRYQVREYESNEGETRQRHEFIIEEVTFLGGGRGNGSEKGSNANEEGRTRSKTQGPLFEEDDEEEEQPQAKVTPKGTPRRKLAVVDDDEDGDGIPF